MFIFLFHKKISFKKKLYFFKYLEKKQINLSLKYLPIHKHKFYKEKYKNKKFKNSELYFNRSFAIPLYYELKIADIDFIVKHIKKAIDLFKI